MAQCFEMETNKMEQLIFERLRDHMEVRFSPLFFILIDLCEIVLHKKIVKNPIVKRWKKVSERYCR